MIVRVIEGLMIFLGFLFVVTQMIIPGWRGTKLFPIFSSKRAELEAARIEANEAADIARMTPKQPEGDDDNAPKVPKSVQ